MQRQINRREMLRNSALAAGGLALSPFLARAFGADESGPRKKVLFFTKSSGFQHSVITRSSTEPEKLSYAEQILTDLGAKHGFDVTCSKDGTIFTPENLKQYDVIAFYTTLDLTQDSANPGYKLDSRGRQVADKQTAPHREPGMGEAGKQAFFDAIKQGKGFIGFHSAADTFHSPGHKGGDLLRDLDAAGHDKFDPYIEMLGGEFAIHGAQQDAILHTIDPKFPGAEAFNRVKFVEEWYSLKNFAPDLHVILAQECTGMRGPMYQRGMYPETWARRHGNGPVFYTSMGHREDVWTRPDFQELVVGALNWTSGRIEVDITPNIQQATPEANVKAS